MTGHRLIFGTDAFSVSIPWQRDLDYIVLIDEIQQKSRLARFVDTMSSNELRPVVDVFFANQAEAIAFGRQHYLAVNISAQDSPFQ